MYIRRIIEGNFRIGNNVLCSRLFAVGFEMNVTFVALLLAMLFLSELLVTRVVAFFFSSLVSAPTVKTNLPPSVKFKNEAGDVDENGHHYRQQSNQKPHIIVILADDMVSR